jgi:alpha-mannosidase
LVDKRLGRELVGYGVPKHMTHVNTRRSDLAMNVFHVSDETPNGMSAWLVNDIVRQENLVQAAEVAVAECGPVYARLTVTHRFRSSRIDEDIIVYRSLPRVDFVIRIDWHELGCDKAGVPRLDVSFNGSMSAPRARFEGPFCITERPADGTEQPTQKWVDVSGEEFGLTLYNDSKYGCSVLGGRISMALLRNPYGPDAETDNGEHVVRLSLEPHAPALGNAELVRKGMSYNRALVPVATSGRAKAAVDGLRVDGADSVVCTAVRHAEHSVGILIRLFESEGKACKAKVTLGRGVTEATEVNFQENPTGGKCRVHKKCVLTNFRPFEVKTLLVRMT